MDSSTATAFPKDGLSPERRDLYARLDKKSTAPLWEVMAKIVPPEPRPEAVPVLWRYQELRPLLMEAGRLLTAKEAERRVLVLENPGLRGQSRATNSMYSGLQLILPGEIAPAHRHAAAALRFVVEGTGAYTAVEGEKTTMHPGDFILTPSWTYHDHGNPGDVPVIWLDGLDVPIVNLFDASFRENFPDEMQPDAVPEGDSHARYAANLLPVDWMPTRPSSPIFNYPYARSREALNALYKNGPVHECHGVKVRYINPAQGGAPMPTIGAFLQLLPKGFQGSPYRATDATIYAAVEGSGQTRIGDQTLTWGPWDVFVAPSWAPVSHHPSEESILFSFSDRPAQQVLGLWREQAPIR